MTLQIEDRIEIDRDVCGGDPCVKGIRLRIDIILEWLEEGETFESIVDAYSFLEIEDIKAVISFARKKIHA